MQISFLHTTELLCVLSSIRQISPSALSVVSPEQEHLKKLFLQAATKQGSASEAQKEIAECDPAAVAV